MPPIVRTIEQIQNDLNGPHNVNGHWIRVPDTYGLTVPIFGSGGQINYFNGQKGIVLVAFINLDNAEVRFFLAKYTDTPERNQLF